MTKQFVSYTSHALAVKYSVSEAQFVSESSTSETARIGILKDEDGERFIFCAKANSIGESNKESDYEHFGWILPFEAAEPKTIAAQLRELADYLENQ